jgi:hypothetical protein
MDKVRRLNKVTFAGADAYEYDGAILPEYAQPLLEGNSIQHTRAWLLTRNKLSSTPEFSITTRACQELDSFHCVFGEILEGMGVLEAVTSLQRYTYNAASGYAGTAKGPESAAAQEWFRSQKEFYVTAGRILGDGRAVDQRGKLLRRVTVTAAGLLV